MRNSRWTYALVGSKKGRSQFDPAATVECFRMYYGPTLRAFATLDSEGQQALRSDLEQLWSAHNRSQNGSTLVDSTYMEVIGTRK